MKEPANARAYMRALPVQLVVDWLCCWNYATTKIRLCGLSLLFSHTTWRRTRHADVIRLQSIRQNKE
jgi:hypothetical protein